MIRPLKASASRARSVAQRCPCGHPWRRRGGATIRLLVGGEEDLCQRERQYAWSPISFDDYCEAHGIKPGEEPAAFAAYLHHITGGAWDGNVEGPIDESW